MVVRAQLNQSWADLALQYLGYAGLAYECAMLNNMLLSDAPPNDADVLLLDTITDQRVVDYYKENGIVPATKYTEVNDAGGFLLQKNRAYLLQKNDGKMNID